MKFIRKLAKWISKQYHFYSSPKFKFELVEDLPELIPERKVLVVVEGNQPDTLAFKCPCGCNSNIFLNLLQDAKPRWKYRITMSGKISISPSIWRRVGCKSHFFITEGKIIWV